MVKEEDLEDPIRAEKMVINKIGSPRTCQRTTKSRRSIYQIASIQLGQPIRLVNMK